MDQCTQAHVRPARATSRLGGESFHLVVGAAWVAGKRNHAHLFCHGAGLKDDYSSFSTPYNKPMRANGFLLAGFISLPMMAADLAPTGTLRATFLGTNPVQGRIDPQTKSVTGPVADLVKELARRLGVPYTIIPAADAREVIDDLNARTADIGFLAYDAPRAAEVDFSRPYALMQNCYLVRADSPVRKSSEVD